MTRSSVAKAGNTTVGFVDRLPSKTSNIVPPTRVRGLVFVLMILSLGLFGGLGTWAGLAPLRTAIVASGEFKVLGDRQIVQHLEGGIVAGIFVEEGALVKKGDLLASLQDARVSAQLGILRGQLASALAQNLRSMAEYSRKDQLELSDELAELIRQEPTLIEAFNSQRDIFESNKRTDAGQAAILQDRINQIDEQIAGTMHRVKSLEKQMELVSGETKDLNLLFEKGLVTKGRFVNRLQAESAIFGDLGTTESQIQGLLQQKSEVQERVIQVRRERMRIVTAERQSVQDRVYDIRQRVEAMLDVRERLAIRAPIAGRVVGLGINTIGEVIESGQKLLDIVPADSTFYIEARVRPSDIDEVVTGGEARVRLTAYSFRTTPVVIGRVTNVSADSFVNEVDGSSYYKITVKVPDTQLKDMANVDIVPGMPAQVLVSTGEQTLLTYLLDPVIGGLGTAFTP
ncbi:MULTISPECIES: HlyD family type I secretion periplasmic adaptor subunit [Rhodobacterales]|uniref:HlyD family type I secretion periplasmic adaptor subunit n=1 Tax=Roseobacter sp. N2S TaxID=2663844 RepID=UPI00285748B2|nr:MULTISPECIES: HlyD family type I secretion periplasmic adaptor subunit [Rhodobacterales]MDR6265012.1 HlyD family type I secretion membrane fusion protein [Roseobacter sp. N2S]